MPNEPNITAPSFWKKFERFAIIIAFLAGIAAIVGFYYQLHTKKSEIEFQIVSKDFLTTNNNIDRLKSNYQYSGIPVDNLWLIKLKFVNTGDITLIGKGLNVNILDTSILFRFSSNVQILDKPKLLQNNFPDHEFKKVGNNFLSLSFQQWRKNEFATYSLYLKSDKKNINLLPTTSRLIKDGDILIVDLTNDQSKNKQSLLDSYFPAPWPLVCRIISIMFALGVFCVMSWAVISIELLSWIRMFKWDKYSYTTLKTFINSPNFYLDDSNFDLITKENFRANQNLYITTPSKIPQNSVFWKKAGIEPKPVADHSITSWKGFFGFLLLIVFIDCSTILIILGMWVF